MLVCLVRLERSIDTVEPEEEKNHKKNIKSFSQSQRIFYISNEVASLKIERLLFLFIIVRYIHELKDFIQEKKEVRSRARSIRITTKIISKIGNLLNFCVNSPYDWFVESTKIIFKMTIYAKIVQIILINYVDSIEVVH